MEDKEIVEGAKAFDRWLHWSGVLPPEEEDVIIKVRNIWYSYVGKHIHEQYIKDAGSPPSPPARDQGGPLPAGPSSPTRSVEDCAGCYDPTGRLAPLYFERWVKLGKAREKAGRDVPWWSSEHPSASLALLTPRERYYLLTGNG